MSSYQSDRDEFLSLMGAEGVPASVARKLLTAASTLLKLAELECSSEAADRDQVRCPAKFHPRRELLCLCQGYGSYAQDHGTVPRYMVQEAKTRRGVEALCAQHSLKPRFGGDPRGAVLVIEVPSGKSNCWGDPGICVPARGFSDAEMERICR